MHIASNRPKITNNPAYLRNIPIFHKINKIKNNSHHYHLDNHANIRHTDHMSDISDKRKELLLRLKVGDLVQYDKSIGIITKIPNIIGGEIYFAINWVLDPSGYWTKEITFSNLSCSLKILSE